MKVPVTENIKYKELAEYLQTEESLKDFLYCTANNIEWNCFLKEKGLLVEKTTYVEIPDFQLHPLNEK